MNFKLPGSGGHLTRSTTSLYLLDSVSRPLPAVIIEIFVSGVEVARNIRYCAIIGTDFQRASDGSNKFNMRGSGGHGPLAAASLYLVGSVKSPLPAKIIE